MDDTEKLIITTLDNLKKMYKENSYLNETDEAKAFKSFSEHNTCADNSDFFMAGIKWARTLNAKDV
jgi:thiamine pyrophosphokinase